LDRLASFHEPILDPGRYSVNKLDYRIHRLLSPYDEA
jgi:hypothetical protein